LPSSCLRRGEVRYFKLRLQSDSSIKVMMMLVVRKV
jgi:hypothetical protein